MCLITIIKLRRLLLMNPELHPLPSERVHERALWAQGIAQSLEHYDKSIKDLPADLRVHCKQADLSLTHISQTDINRLWTAAARLSKDDCFCSGLLIPDTEMGGKFTAIAEVFHDKTTSYVFN
ncbi:MAG: hypothetical protein CMK78_08780 [Pseudomonadales bacterium]|nr:hypothetical protein [Pseudomonadales bacterium]